MNQSHAILQRLLKLHPKSIDLSLDRMVRLLNALGNPEKHLPPVFHIAGTNGKGSTTAFLRAFLESADYSTHVYTSPHLVNFNERVRIGHRGGGKLVSDQLLSKALQICEAANQSNQITFFEITTAAALLLFVENSADALILEVGLGGRLDATNVIANPEVTIITSISLDHEQWLGDHLIDIANEKAGIIKKGVPVVIAPQTEEVMKTIITHAQNVGAPTIIGGRDFVVYEENSRLVFQNKDRLLDLPLPTLQGKHQFDNAALALAALGASRFWSNELDFENGLRSVSWPARMQLINSGVLMDLCPSGSEIWLDGGHNPSAGTAMARLIADLNERQSKPLYLVAGMLNTKCPTGYFTAFNGLVRNVVTIPIKTAEASFSAEELAEFARKSGLRCDAKESLEIALKHVTKLAKIEETPPRILICGSLYLAGEVLKKNDTHPT